MARRSRRVQTDCASASPWVAVLSIIFLTACVLLSNAQHSGSGVYSWMGYDNFDAVDAVMSSVNGQNCRTKSAADMTMPDDVVAQKPRFNRLLSYIVYPNRTKLLHLHNMALNRAFFYSYMFQKLNESQNFVLQPGLLYYYFSAAADISANEYSLNGSGIFFDNNASYANWYRNLKFNDTLPLFGPRAYRHDDFNEPTNWVREPTNWTINIDDYGTGPQSNYTKPSYKNNQFYSMWLPDGWDKKGLDSARKWSYAIGVKYSNQTGKFISNEFTTKTLFGPPSPGQKASGDLLPVVWTQPYFDCGRTNRWLIGAVAPVVDQVPRYLDWMHLRRMTFVATSVMEMEFLAIDMNQCPIGTGNEGPSRMAATARCKSSTICEPLYGWGFRRGGYQCMCKPGFRYPPWQLGPFQGIEIDSATEEEYKNGFDCIPVELRQVIPLIRGNDTAGTPNVNVGTLGKKKRSTDEDDEIQKKWRQPDWVLKSKIPSSLDGKSWRSTSQESRVLGKKLRFLRMLKLKEQEETTDKVLKRRKKVIVPQTSYPYHLVAEKNKKVSYVPRYKHEDGHIRRKRQSFDPRTYDRMMAILVHKENVTTDNCDTYKTEDLQLPGDVAYNVEKGFSNQARTALRLSHFLSNFLQNNDIYEEYGNLRGDNPLNVEQLFGEVLANVMGDLKIKGSGIFFDIDKFKNLDGSPRQFFGPYAYRYDTPNMGSGPESDNVNSAFRAVDYAGFPTSYLDDPWFKIIKERWQSNTYGLTKFTEKPMIRSDVNGTSLRKFEIFPLYFKAPREQDGIWTAPYFDCDGYVNDWVVTYSVPFFGYNSIHRAIEFKGVVIVDVKLDELDLYQCPQDYFVPNAFKDTARCHYETTYCVFLEGKKFIRGNYKCECKVGYEYPFNDRAWYFDGQQMEEEWRKKMAGDLQNRYDNLECRISGASRSPFSVITIVLLVIISALTTR